MSLDKIAIIVNRGSTLVEVKDVPEANPYVSLQIGRQRYKTTIKKGDCPEWNEGFVFDNPNDSYGWILRLDVINDDKIKQSNFNGLGSTALDLNTLTDSLPKKIVVDTTFGHLLITIIDADKSLTMSKSISGQYDRPWAETAQKMSLPMTYPYENVWKRDGIKFVYNIDNINTKQDEMATRAVRNNWRYSQANMRFRTIAAREAGLTAENLLAERNKTRGPAAISGDTKTVSLIDNYNIYAPTYSNIPDPTSNKAFYSTIINTNIQNQSYNTANVPGMGTGSGTSIGGLSAAENRELNTAEAVSGDAIKVPLEEFPYPGIAPDSRLATATSSSFSSTAVTRNLLQKEVDQAHLRDIANVGLIAPYEFCTIYHQDYEDPSTIPLYSKTLKTNAVAPLSAKQSENLEYQSPEILILKNNNRAKRRTDQVYNASDGVSESTSHPLRNLPRENPEDADITRMRAPIQNALSNNGYFPTPNQLLKQQAHLAAHPPPPASERDASSIANNNLPASYHFPTPGAPSVAPKLKTEYITAYVDPNFVPRSIPTLSSTRGLDNSPPHDYAATHFHRDPKYMPEGPTFDPKSYYSPNLKYSHTQPTQESAFRTATLSYPVPLMNDEQARDYVNATATVDPSLISSTRGLISTTLSRASTLDAPPLKAIPAQYKYSNSLRPEDDHDLYGMTHAAHRLRKDKYPVLGKIRYDMEHPTEPLEE